MEEAPKISKNAEAVSAHHNVEDVVAHTQEAVQVCATNPDSPLCDPKSIHDEICGTELRELFSSYENGELPTRSDFQFGLDQILVHIETELGSDEMDPEEREFGTAKMKILSGRMAEMNTGIRRYMRTLSKFFQLRKQIHRLEPDEFKIQMEEADRQRRAAHDMLIEALSIYTATVRELKEYGFLERLQLIEWNHGMDISQFGTKNDQAIVFSDQILKNRDMIKDWAVSAHLYERLERINEIKKNGIEK